MHSLRAHFDKDACAFVGAFALDDACTLEGACALVGACALEGACALKDACALEGACALQRCHCKRHHGVALLIGIRALST